MQWPYSSAFQGYLLVLFLSFLFPGFLVLNASEATLNLMTQILFIYLK